MTADWLGYAAKSGVTLGTSLKLCKCILGVITHGSPRLACSSATSRAAAASDACSLAVFWRAASAVSPDRAASTAAAHSEFATPRRSCSLRSSSRSRGTCRWVKPLRTSATSSEHTLRIASALACARRRRAAHTSGHGGARVFGLAATKKEKTRSIVVVLQHRETNRC